MRSSTHLHLWKLQLEADKSRVCIVARTSAEQRLLNRQKKLGTVVSPWRGMYMLAESWDGIKPTERTRRIVRTLALEHPKWVFCGATAALMHGLEVSCHDLLPVQVVLDPSARSRSTKCITRRPLLLSEPPVMADGVLVTPLEQTVMDCLISMTFQRGLAVADSALRLNGLGREHFMAYVEAHGEVIGWKRALDPLEWADGRAANGGESIARAVMIEQGFMVPDLQVEVPNPIEGGAYCEPFLWELPDGTHVVGELDGLDKYYDPTVTEETSSLQEVSEAYRRETRIGAAGYRFMLFSFDEVARVDPFVKVLEVYGIPRGAMRMRGQ